MKVLFIGGTGVISSACTAAAINRGTELHLLNRKQTQRTVPEGARIIEGDIRDHEAMTALFDQQRFDVVVDWIAYTREHVMADVKWLEGRVGQYVFISSASAYKKPPDHWPITENNPLENPFWAYSQAKIDCENYLMKQYRENGFPVTIVRPSHTYDRTKIPLPGGYTALNRLRQNKKVILHGDGTSLWTLTHHHDFAKGFLGILGNPACIGEAYHITSDEVLTWNQICETLAGVLGVRAHIVHIPSKVIRHYDREWGDGLLGDKAHCLMFDNSKIKSVVPGFKASIPFAQGAREMADWFMADASRQITDPEKDALMDRLIEKSENLLNH